ncbi:MAG TPA: hypothetical protein VFB23_12455 [Candidatus Acidoferrales bacterium]|nr:hypothetical protein [Candidatus Acidoferrales bacterium]HZS71710.1 hypothetical protein [Candidatus Acidoferrum sp.]
MEQNLGSLFGGALVAVPQTAVGTTSVNGSAIDMQGYDGVTFIGVVGAFTDGSFDLKAQDDTSVGMGAASDLAGTKTSATASNKLVILDVYRPQKRFIRPVVARGGATGSVIGSVVAIRYVGDKNPVPAAAQDASIAAIKSLASPANGTA